MSLDCRSWGRGRSFRGEFTEDPYDDQVASLLHIWFLVDDESQIRTKIKMARRTWKLVTVYTSNDPDLLPSALQPGCISRPRPPVYWLVYERQGGAPQCGEFS